MSAFFLWLTQFLNSHIITVELFNEILSIYTYHDNMTQYPKSTQPICYLEDEMNRSYNKLWKLMIDKKMNKTQLREAAKITSNAMAKLGKDESVPVETLEKICRVLDCTIDDIMEFDQNEQGAIQ